jgi:hypothetical protein
MKLVDIQGKSRVTMPKRIASVDLDKDIKIGEGDETISDWHHGFDVIR